MERAMLSSWPALSTAYDGDWLIRLSKGVTKRSNSVVCLGSDDKDLENRIDRMRALFEHHGLPPLFRLSPLAPNALQEALDARGWRCFDETIVMTADLTTAASGHIAQQDLPFAIEIDVELNDLWLEGCARLNDYSRTHKDTLEQLLQGLVPIAGYGRLTGHDGIAALGIAVVDHDLVGLFEVLTAEGQRRQGLARMLQSRLLLWGQDQGATTGWLAVVAGNDPACHLYRSLGFREVYRYHYCCEDG
ncbi:MAG: GNAT family N-acetyltransferase [Geminicoccaceae bacterium]